MKRCTKNIILSIGIVFIFCTIITNPIFAKNAPELLEPTLQIDIPTVTFSKGTIDGNVIKVNYLGDYIAGIYKYLLGISTTIAIVMIMVSGLQWSLGGASPEAIGKAKTRMKNAVTGLILLLCTYIILFTVNPNLIKIQFPELKNIDFEPILADSGDAPGSINWTELKEKLAELGITCAGDGESGDVSSIAKSFVGKVTYRFGGKGDEPPYSGEGDHTQGNQKTADFCPDETVCLDCSGFAGALAQCAGLESLFESGGTASIFSNAEKITECGEDYVSTESESIDITEGDLVGFKAGDKKDSPNFGHVWMYIGDGKVISAMGGDFGRIQGNSVQTQSLKSICKTYPLRIMKRE